MLQRKEWVRGRGWGQEQSWWLPLLCPTPDDCLKVCGVCIFFQTTTLRKLDQGYRETRKPRRPGLCFPRQAYMNGLGLVVC